MHHQNHEKISETPNAGMLKHNLVPFLSWVSLSPLLSFRFQEKTRQSITGAVQTTPLLDRQFRTNILAFTGGGKNPRFQPQNVPWQQAVFE